ncbi:MAG TPA: VWA domain-containing protein [Solirubrobacteraceae bacterium]|nr:VWA domain-containing protein [Solirubrobacteraceae bacterium]
MSFGTPLLLLCLLALPALAAWYVSRQRTRRLALAAFAAPRMTPSALPDSPRWRRHAPIAAFALTLALLVIAAAKPRMTVSRVVEHLQTMLALDMSGSMQSRDVLPSRAAAAQRAADDFVEGVPAGVAVGVMQFNQAPQLLATPTANHRAAIEALGRLRIGGGTAVGSAVQAALAILRPAADPGSAQASGALGGTGGGGTSGGGTSGGEAGGGEAGGGRTSGGGPSALGGANAKSAAAIVLLSDGGSTSGDDPFAAARAARRLHIPVFTVAVGTPSGTISVRHRDGRGSATIPVPVQSRELAQVAALSGGRAYTAADAGHLSAIYKQLSARLSHRSERRDLTPYFLGAGLALLLLGSALSLSWFGRLI